jgi:GMP synthase - Glutamine amidotransferase domain
MARILSVQHWAPRYGYDNEGFFARRGDRVENLLLFAGEKAPDPRLYDLVIVYGGLMSAYDDQACPWISRELAFLEDCARHGTKILGICLGSQLLARMLGARVYRSDHPECGFKEITLTATGRRDPELGSLGDEGGRFLSLEWHDDAWDLPSGTELLASDAAWPNQAFRYENMLAIQFHLEFTQPHIRGFIEAPGFVRSSDPAGEEPDRLVAPGPRYAEIAGNMETLLEAMLAAGDRVETEPLAIGSPANRS